MTGMELIAAERQRQIDVEGWTAEHDAQHTNGELLQATICYTSYALGLILGQPYPKIKGSWPWDFQYWKPGADPICNLIKAGALIAAEIDRLQRKRAP